MNATQYLTIRTRLLAIIRADAPYPYTSGRRVAPEEIRQTMPAYFTVCRRLREMGY